LTRDQSIDCEVDEHRLFKKYATIMMFVYPIGIPGLYLFVLSKNRKRIMAADREYDVRIHKSSFLWENYKPEFWWWEGEER
jgi:hypothetical protein